MPKNAIYVGRPTIYGNPFTVADYGPGLALRNFQKHINAKLQKNPKLLEPLKGKDLACWCPVGEPCHADMLLELANYRYGRDHGDAGER